MEKPDFIHETFIATTQDKLWDALTKPEVAAAFHMACDVAEALPDGGVKFILPNGNTMLTQRYTKIEPKTRIESTFEPDFGNGMTEVSRCVYIVTPEARSCKLRIEHYGVPSGQDGVAEGWARWAASLKSYLETGNPIKGFGE
ncbi:MAG: SRPBCC domain-containing protein [Pseudomonadota bacterium]